MLGTLRCSFLENILLFLIEVSDNKTLNIKVIDLNGFADGYSTYDLLAKRSRPYALAYPFIELALGILELGRLEGRERLAALDE